MANNPYVNKVQLADGTSLIDISSDTVTADKLMQGYTAHDRTGALITGTATGGSGGSVTQDQDGFIVLPPTGGGTPSASGLVYEMGTWSPSEETNYPTISFSNTHSTLPIIIEISDTSGTFTPSGTAACILWGYYDAWKTTGYGFPTPDIAYSYIDVYYQSTSGNSSSTRRAVTHNSSESGSGTDYASYYVTESAFMPYTLGTRYFKAGRTYKWIAVWAPTT